MSVTQISRALYGPREIKGSNLLVLIALAENADDEGYCFPSVARIARKARVTERQVRRATAWLRARGYLVRAVKEGPQKDPRYRSNSYWLKLPPPDMSLDDPANLDRTQESSLESQTGQTGHPDRTNETSRPDPHVRPTVKEPSKNRQTRARARDDFSNQGEEDRKGDGHQAYIDARAQFAPARKSVATPTLPGIQRAETKVPRPTISTKSIAAILDPKQRAFTLNLVQRQWDERYGGEDD